ncbi:MAG: class I SAM-dependent methyltransferase [Acetobacter sp.]|nr:class I SAM-dependent methyltransferase [Bacteroides sp.]MCM1341398.1 class I SAM-dependent methyltransferase [Acetobacter sp.]MCM1433352.1 class I SAM-dependent methyltransferase [Clostridiales bacterium]
MIRFLTESERKKKLMSSYQTFAEFYDRLTENVDYKVRSEYISNFFSRYGKNEKTVLDLACGTGSISKYLSEKSYSVIGIDLSDEMLTQAINKEINNAFFVKADISDFRLPERVNYCVCSLDSINHLSSITDVENCFKCVYECLNTGGVFVFDVNTLYKHENILSNNTFVFDEEDFFLSWDNEYLGEGTVRILLDFFIFNGNNYDRYSEEFCEKAYTLDSIICILEKIGFSIIGVYNDLTENPSEEDSERVYFVVRKI